MADTKITSSYFTDIKVTTNNPSASLPFSQIYHTGSNAWKDWYSGSYDSASAYDEINIINEAHGLSVKFMIGESIEDEAINDLSRATYANPKYTVAYYELGIRTFQTSGCDGETPIKILESIKSFSKVIELDSTYTDAFYQRSKCYERLGEIALDPTYADWPAGTRGRCYKTLAQQDLVTYKKLS